MPAPQNRVAGGARESVMAGRSESGIGHDGRLTASLYRAVILFVSLVLLAVPLLAATPDDGGKVSPELARRARDARPDDLIPVIVQTVSDTTDDHLGRMNAGGGLLKRRHSSIKGYSAVVPAAEVDALAGDPEVERVSLDAPVRAFLDIAVKAARLDAALAEHPSLDGSGVGIALVDTGVSLHPDLDRRPPATRPVEIDFVARDHQIDDPFGHGTHVAGVLTGNGLLSSGPDAYRTFRGLAPGARLISLRALMPDGSGQTSDVLAAIDWAVQHRKGYGIRVLNLSLGHPVYESYLTDPLCRAASAAVAAGIVVVAAAGNDGRIGSGFGTIVSPANDPSVIAVGAMDDNNTVAREDDVLAPFSSRGPSLIDQIVKPDLVAPGTLIVSLRAAGSVIDLDHHDLVLHVSEYRTGPDGDRDGDYLTLSGTSLAAPMVSGAAALLLEADPTLTPADVKTRLMASAQHDGGLPFETGAGYLDVQAALASGAHSSTALSPRAVPGPAGTIVLEPLGGGWDGEWQQSLIWGGGRQLGMLLETENDMVTASGLVWGGGRSIVDATGLVWGGGSSKVGISDADLVCTGIVWGGGH
jgi:serine protease AprX